MCKKTSLFCEQTTFLMSSILMAYKIIDHTKSFITNISHCQKLKTLPVVKSVDFWLWCVHVTPMFFCRMILEIIGHPVTLQTLVHTCAILKIWNFTFLVFLGVILCVLIKPSINILFQFTFTIFQWKMTLPMFVFSLTMTC